MKKYIQKVQIWRINRRDLSDECSRRRDHEEKPTGLRNKTRGFQNGRKVVLTRPPPDASQFKEGQCSCCIQAHLIPDCPKFKKIVKPETIKHHPKRSSMLPLS